MKWEEDTVSFGPSGRRQWHLQNDHGVRVATAWDNGTWHTWDAEGVGGENGTDDNVDAARAEATLAVVRQGFHELRQIPENLDSRAVRELVFCLHIYPNYRVDSRGPLGCIYDALEELSPQLLRQIQEDGVDAVYNRYFSEEEDEH